MIFGLQFIDQWERQNDGDIKNVEGRTREEDREEGRKRRRIARNKKRTFDKGKKKEKL